MRISVNWLRELVDISMTPPELGELLTLAGFEVEEIEDRSTFADGVVVGRVTNKQPHPNADKLSVCQVDIGTGETQTIVCGAPNVRADIWVPVATVGTYLPAIELQIEATSKRGVSSHGMICSLAELGLAKESEGIHIFSQDSLAAGMDVRPLLGLDDIVLDLTTTANRADALSMVGVAREVAALTGATLHLPIIEALQLDPSEDITLDISDSEATPAYIATVLEGLRIAPSPDWLRWRLLAAGVRPISNIVDITNYVLLEWGQPLHAFDRDRIRQITGTEKFTIGVRFSRPKEELVTLDGQTRQLQETNLVITAEDKPVALAGVMGGETSEVHSGTQNVMLEAALFSPVAIRRSARAVGLRTEASTRYERGVNQAELEAACNRCVALMVELAGGKVTSRVVADARPDPQSWSRSLSLRFDRIHQLLGKVKTEDGIGFIAAADVERILKALGCQLSEVEAGIWNVKVPPYRYRDLEREIDLIEEVARLYGYDRFCDDLPAKTLSGGLSSTRKAKNRIREAFRAVGLTEVVHYSLVKPQDDPQQIRLSNPLFSEYSALRTELLDGAIDAFAYNLSRGNGALNAFEIGRRFWQEEGFQEADAIVGIMGGDYFPQGRWKQAETAMNWYAAKGLLASALDRLGATLAYHPETTDPRFHPGRTASLWLEGQHIGIFGQLHPELRARRDLIDEVYAFSLDLSPLIAFVDRHGEVLFDPYSTYPAVARDLAFFASVDLSVATLSQAIENAGGELLERLELFDEYRGENVPAGQRSLAFNLVYRAQERTLTDEEVEPFLEQVRKALVKQFNVTLRS